MAILLAFGRSFSIFRSASTDLPATLLVLIVAWLIIAITVDDGTATKGTARWPGAVVLILALGAVSIKLGSAPFNHLIVIKPRVVPAGRRHRGTERRPHNNCEQAQTRYAIDREALHHRFALLQQIRYRQHPNNSRPDVQGKRCEQGKDQQQIGDNDNTNPNRDKDAILSPRQTSLQIAPIQDRCANDEEHQTENHPDGDQCEHRRCLLPLSEAEVMYDNVKIVT